MAAVRPTHYEAPAAKMLQFTCGTLASFSDEALFLFYLNRRCWWLVDDERDRDEGGLTQHVLT